VTKGWQEIGSILARHGAVGKPIWYSEVGWPIFASEGGGFPDKAMHRSIQYSAMGAAACVTKMYALAMRLGVRPPTRCST
jgi:hypothetical protein